MAHIHHNHENDQPEDNDLPDRLVNPEEYQQLLPTEPETHQTSAQRSLPTYGIV